MFSVFVIFFLELREEGKKHRQRDSKHPDLQWYKPGAAHPHRRKNSAEGAGSDPVHPSDDCVLGNDTKMPGGSPTSPGCSHVSTGEFPNDHSQPEANHNTKGHVGINNHQLVDGNAVKSIEGAGTPRSPKQSRKMRKPDREIYQPGGRRSQVHKETGVSKELDGDRRREEDEVSGKSAETIIKCEKEEKRRNRRGKDGRKKQESKGNVDSPSANKNENNVESITGKVSNLHLESEESKDGAGQDCTTRRKPSGEGRRSQAGGGNEVTGEDKKKERGNGKSRAGREKVNNQGFAKKEEGEGGGKGSEAHQLEGKKQRNVGRKEVSRGQNMNHEKQQGNRPKEKGRPSERTDSNRVNSASKRYSQSDTQRPRNRTYSTSSASSGNSMDGLAEAERLRREGLSTAERAAGQKEFVRGSQGRPRRRMARTLSSTDSLEENEVWEREDRRGRVADEAKSTHKGPEGGGRGQRAPASSGRGGLLRVSLDKHSSEEQASRKNPRGRGRGILVLPAHTDLTLTPEPGPQLGAMRGGMGLGRGRGGRGGGTRRLWDPNNPDKKPALVSSQQSQHASLQQALYLQQGGCGPLHFLDTDDETTGSPPVRQGEFFQNQQAAVMAYYKFQNSDNPYSYPLSANSPNTPPRYPYPYHIPYQIPGSNGMYPASMPPFYGPYGQGGSGYPSPAGSGLNPEEAEVHTRGELGKLLRLADSQELQLSNLLSRERLSQEGLERMAQLRCVLNFEHGKDLLY